MLDATIHELFAEQVAIDPDTCALAQGTCTLSYRELDEASDAVARFLLDRGVAPEECVAVHAGRTMQMVAASLGVLKAGACYLPLDPALPAERKRFIIEDTHARIVLAEGAADLGASWVQGAHCCSIDNAWRFTHVARTQLPRTGSKNLAYIMYTSGSTGHPKGVLIQHRSVACLVKGNHYAPLERNDRMLLAGGGGAPGVECDLARLLSEEFRRIEAQARLTAEERLREVEEVNEELVREGERLQGDHDALRAAHEALKAEHAQLAGSHAELQKELERVQQQLEESYP